MESAGKTGSKRHDKFVSLENFVKELVGGGGGRGL